MSELKKCYCDYIPPQYFATKSLPTALNVHEVCSSSSEFKPFIEGPKYLINSHFHFLQLRRHHALLTKFSRSHVNNKCFFLIWRQIIPNVRLLLSKPLVMLHSSNPSYPFISQWRCLTGFSKSLYP